MTKSTQTVEKPTKSLRIVIDIPTSSVNNLRTLCDLMGETQSAMVTKAIDTFVEDKKDTIEKFLKLRNEISK